MVRKLLPAALIVSILTSCVLGIMLLSQRPENRLIEELDTASRNTQLKSVVESGIITSEFYTEGRVVSNNPEHYLDTITLEFKRQSDRDGFKMYKELTADVNKGEKLYSFRGKENVALNNCRLVDVQIARDMATIVLLNYDQLYIETAVGLDKLEYLNLYTMVSLHSRAYDAVISDGSIINIGYEVENGQIPVIIKTKERMLPGTEVKVIFSATRNVPSLYVLKEMLKQDSDGYYLEIFKGDGTRERASVEIGDYFTTYQGDTPTEFVEILCGVSEGVTVITDVIQVVNAQREVTD